MYDVCGVDEWEVCLPGRAIYSFTLKACFSSQLFAYSPAQTLHNKVWTLKKGFPIFWPRLIWGLFLNGLMQTRHRLKGILLTLPPAYTSH